jgi:hypothetical protein
VSDTSYPPPPPPGQPYGLPYGAAPQPRPQGNGQAVAAFVLGVVALVVAAVPLVGILAIGLALLGIGLGISGLARGRRLARRAHLAGWGIGLSVVALAVCAVVSYYTLRYLGDWFDTVDPPAPSAEVGEWFTTDDGDLRIKVTSLECHPDDTDDVGPHDRACTFAFDVENRSDRVVHLDDIRIKSVEDGAWGDSDITDPAVTDGYQYGVDVAAGEEKSLLGTVDIGTRHLDGIAFDADDASSHSAVVVDAGDASSGQ